MTGTILFSEEMVGLFPYSCVMNSTQSERTSSECFTPFINIGLTISGYEKGPVKIVKPGLTKVLYLKCIIKYVIIILGRTFLLIFDAFFVAEAIGEE